MDRTQPLLLIVMITLFGIAIAGAIWIFGKRNVEVRRDSIMTEIGGIAADAYQYRLRPATMGGGGGSYARYAIPPKHRLTGFANYSISPTSSADTLFITVTAVQKTGTIIASIDPGGVLRIVSQTGDLSY